MILTADYHTHTTYSHGKGSVMDNALAAKNIGLKEIGISDHGFKQLAFGLRKRRLESLINDCRAATEATGVKTLVGIEANFLSDDGKCDLDEKLYDKFDLFLAGAHKFVAYKTGTFFRYFLPTLTTGTFKTAPSQRLVKETTELYINVIKNNPVDAITHLNYCCFADAYEVASAAADHGTYIELNAKKVHLTDGEIEKILKTDVRFILSSDAHSPNRVGEVNLAAETVEKMGIPKDRIDNIDGRLPSFRFAEYKNKR